MSRDYEQKAAAEKNQFFASSIFAALNLGFATINICNGNLYLGATSAGVAMLSLCSVFRSVQREVMYHELAEKAAPSYPQTKTAPAGKSPELNA